MITEQCKRKHGCLGYIRDELEATRMNRELTSDFLAGTVPKVRDPTHPILEL